MARVLWAERPITVYQDADTSSHVLARIPQDRRFTDQENAAVAPRFLEVETIPAGLAPAIRGFVLNDPASFDVNAPMPVGWRDDMRVRWAFYGAGVVLLFEGAVAAVVLLLRVAGVG